MCGIAGFVSQNRLKDVQRTLNAMLTRISHRGPDECGLFLTDNACMGNVRLSIVDLKTGQQPMCTPDGRYWIAYNGEVFNYIELKIKLERLGHVFKTNCDTEVVLHMYQEFGVQCLKQFNGQFAFSIWDTLEKELFLARDRMGIRPLFYTQQKDLFVYASEIKSILEHASVERALNHKSLQQVFTFWTTLTPNTIFKDIYEVPPGNYAIVNKGVIKLKSYWTLDFSTNNKFGLYDAIDYFRELFKDSLALRMRADVPVAAYLSGGIDSTSTTAYLKNMFPDELNTFSIGFEEKDFDESVFQKEVADYFKTKHHSVSFKNEDVVDLFKKVIWHTEIPLLRSAPFPMFKLSKLVRDNDIKVVITGEGADEMLGGYNIFKELIIRHFWAKDPSSRMRPLLLKKLYPYLSVFQGTGSNMMKLFFGYKLSETNSPIYSHMLRWHNTSRINNHFSADVKEQLNGSDFISDYENEIRDKLKEYSPLQRAQYIESTVFMSGYLLSSQGDRVAMGNSVEGRYPFLDHRIVEFCSSLHDDLKIKGLEEKFLLKQVVKDVIPKSVLNRPKQAYRAPISQSLLADKSGFVNEFLLSSKISAIGIFDKSRVANLINKMNNSKHKSEIDNMALMGILSTQLIHDLFFKDFKFLKDHEINAGIIMNR